MKRFKRKNNKIALALALVMAVLLLLPQPVAKAAGETVLYNAKISTHYRNSVTTVYEKPDKDSAVLTTYKPGRDIQIVEVLPNYVGIVYGNRVGYVLRHRIMDPVAVDMKNTPRFGTAFNRYFAVADQDILVKESQDENSPTLITLHKGAMIGFLDVTDGWARTIFKRKYGYVDTRTLPELQMVAASEELGTDEVPIAVYNSFYDVTDNENVNNRIHNLAVGGERMSKIIPPGQSMDFNKEVGPFTARNGYKPAGGLVDGELVFDVYGGGSCQVSSTLYNVILQLNGLTVLKRAPHGINGIWYLPFGVDASSGALNLVFRNDYPFPVSIRTHVQDGSLFIAFYKEST